ncbi:MAG: hypothetical protein ACLT98_12805 [Eggerthellaceae bacterium]
MKDCSDQGACSMSCRCCSGTGVSTLVFAAMMFAADWRWLRRLCPFRGDCASGSASRIKGARGGKTKRRLFGDALQEYVECKIEIRSLNRVDVFQTTSIAASGFEREKIGAELARRVVCSAQGLCDWASPGHRRRDGASYGGARRFPDVFAFLLAATQDDPINASCRLSSN